MNDSFSAKLQSSVPVGSHNMELEFPVLRRYAILSWICSGFQLLLFLLFSDKLLLV